MNTRNLLLLATLVGLGSCTTMYKSGQTPDDVYYSPGQAKEGYVQSKNNQDNNQPYNGNQTSDDYLRMKVQDPARWSTLDYDMYGNYYPSYSPMNPFYNPFTPYGYGFSPYGGLGFGFGWGSYMGFGGGMYYGSYYNPFSFYGGYYPYYPYYAPPVVIIKGGSGNVNPYVNGPRTFNMAGYGNTAYVRSTSIKTSAPASAGPAPVRVFGNNLNNSSTGYSGSSGGYLRGGSSGSNPFRPSSGSNGSSTRTFEPRSSGSSSGSGSSTRSSGGGGGGSSPSRSFPGRR